MERAFTPSDLIELFLDGEATSDERELLFTALGQSSALKAEFDEALKLRSAFTLDAESLSPSATWENGVFERIDEIEQHATSATVAAESSLLAGASYAGTLARNFLATAGWGMIGVVAMLVMTNLPTVSRSDLRATVPAAIVSRAVNNAPSGTSAGVVQRAAAERVMPVHRSSIEYQATQVFIDSATARANDNASAAIARSPISPVIESEAVLPSIAMPTAVIGSAMDTSLPVQEDLLHRFSLKASGMFALGGAAQSPRDDFGHEFTHNASIAIEYALNDEQTIGIAVGRQSFSAISSVDREEHIEHQPILWGGATYKLSPSAFRIAETIAPFASSTAAISDKGPMLRATLGLAWTPTYNTSVTMGIEPVGLLFRDQSNWNTTGNISLVVGAAVRL